VQNKIDLLNILLTLHYSRPLSRDSKSAECKESALRLSTYGAQELDSQREAELRKVERKAKFI